MSILSGIVIILLLFGLSLLFPFLSFLIPVYKFRKVWGLSLREKVVINAAPVLIIGVFMPQLLFFYIGLFCVVEFLYAKLRDRNWKTFDKIVVVSLAASIGLVLGSSFAVRYVTGNEELLKTISALLKVDPEKFAILIGEGTKSLISAMFLSAMFCTFLSYLFMEHASYLDWDISYWWLILYIAPFFLDRFWLPGNYYIINIKEVGLVIFAFYGMKSIYEALCYNFPNFRYRYLFHFLSCYVTIAIPVFSFIVGGVAAFDRRVLHFRKKS